MTVWSIKHTGPSFVIRKNNEYYMKIEDDITADLCDKMHIHFNGRLMVYGVLAEYIRAEAPKAWTKEECDEADR